MESGCVVLVRWSAKLLMCCVIFLGHIQEFGLTVAGESHPDASALDQRVPSAALTNIWMCPSVTGGLRVWPFLFQLSSLCLDS